MKRLFYKIILCFLWCQYHMLVRDANYGKIDKDKTYFCVKWFYLRKMVKVKFKIQK